LIYISLDTKLQFPYMVNCTVDLVISSIYCGGDCIILTIEHSYMVSRHEYLL
jgi:hypothetical protein